MTPREVLGTGGPGLAGKGDPVKGIPDLTAQPAGHLQQLFPSDPRNRNDLSLKALKALFTTRSDEEIADLAADYSSLR